MSASAPTMKSIHKRLYTVFPRTVTSSATSPGPSSPSASSSRVRSNSASRSLYTSSGPLSFFEPGVPPPNGRSLARLPAEAVKPELELQPYHQHQPHPTSNPSSSTHHGPPFPLALVPQPSQLSSLSSPTLFPLAYQNPFASLALDPTLSAPHDPQPPVKRQRTRYRFDVGAYGIPKKHKPSRPGTGPSDPIVVAAEDQSLAVQVGEDAYFVRDNAMGVADGVGGWSRLEHKDPTTRRANQPTASALFARRLMHYCSAEVNAAATPSPSHISPPIDIPRPRSPPKTSPSAFFYPTPRPTRPFDPWAEDDECERDEVEELAEGLDVLMILERAYENTIKAHVVPKRDAPSIPARYPPVPYPPLSPGSYRPSTPISLALSSSPSTSSPLAAQGTVPLLAGSSTALVAILDCASASLSGPDAQDPSKSDERTTAMLRIAHLGDSMGMLVRGDEVVWRSEEMWSSFNTPLQLGPSSATRPSDARVINLPVQPDDILILASDGLSDNLWDEEVLDEVVRFRKSFLTGGTAGLLGRRTLAGMLSEALCSRARSVSQRRARPPSIAVAEGEEEEVPFARRAREQGKAFQGGKTDDISVCVAVISDMA